MKKYTTLLILIIFVIAPILNLAGCNSFHSNIYFGTNCDLELKGFKSNKISQDIFKIFDELESSISTSVVDSEIYLLNKGSANSPIPISEYSKFLFDLSKTFNSLDASFNPAIYPVVDMWNFGSTTYIGATSQIPTDEQIQETLEYCKFDNFVLDHEANTLTKTDERSSIDFGALAKGYACDLAYNEAKLLNKAVINIGGTIRTNSEILVYIKNPRETTSNPFAATININNESISTSGDYERFYFFEGKRYHHIFDNSGYPAGLFSLNPIISVSIIGPTATICDALSTLIFISGLNIKTTKILEDYDCKAILFRENSYETYGEVDITILDDKYISI